MFALGYFMVSRWRFPSLKSFQIRVPSFQMVFVVVISAVLLFFGMLQHFSFVLVALAWGYILVALVLSTARMIGGSRFKSLKDFDPVDEE